MSADLASLEARIRKIEDIEAIRALRMQYHYCINEGKLDQVGGIYTEDTYVEFVDVGSARGRKDAGALIAHLAGSLDLIKQFITNHMVTVDGDEAEGVSYLDARYAYGGKSIVAAAKYAEKYRRTSEGWKISEMICTTYFTVPVQKGWADYDKSEIIKVPVPQQV